MVKKQILDAAKNLAFQQIDEAANLVAWDKDIPQNLTESDLTLHLTVLMLRISVNLLNPVAEKMMSFYQN